MSVGYNFGGRQRLLFRLRWNYYTKWMAVIKKVVYVYLRLRLFGFKSHSSCINVMSRLAHIQSFKIKRDKKEAFKTMCEVISKLSDETGVPQWEIRSQIQRDFNIDI